MARLPPHVPARPSNEKSGLVSSRIKEFGSIAATDVLRNTKPAHIVKVANFASKNVPPSVFHDIGSSLPQSDEKKLVSCNVQLAHKYGPSAMKFAAEVHSKIPSSAPPLPPEKPTITRPKFPSKIALPTAVVSPLDNNNDSKKINSTEAQRSADFSVRNIKDRFEKQAFELHPQEPTHFQPRPATKSRPISHYVDDRQHDDGVRTLRAELESKLILRSPETHHPPTSTSAPNYEKTVDDWAFENQNNMNKKYLQAPVASQQNFSVGFQTAERAFPPPPSRKSPPPPRPPPCNMSRSVSMGNISNRRSSGQEQRTQSPPQEPHGIVLHDFYGQEADELTSLNGDKIILKKSVDNDWLYAYNPRTFQTGIIPASFVDIRIPLRNDSPVYSHGDDNRSPEPPAGPRCYTLHDFISSTEGDLTFLKGEVLKLTKRVNQDWLEGEADDHRKGIFPASFVEIIEDLPVEGSVSKTAQSNRKGSGAEILNGVMVTALYDFASCNPGDLQFLAGDQIISKAQVNTDWLYGCHARSKEAGIFPTSFVDRTPANLPPYDWVEG